jgi:hypothetical protein
LIPRIWVECKNVKLKKLVKLGRWLENGNIYWINTYDSLSRSIKSIQKRKKVKIPNNIFPIGIRISEKELSYFIDSLSKKPIHWNVIQEEKTSFFVSVRNNEFESLNLKFFSVPNEA